MAAPAIKNWQGVVLHKLGAPVTQANVTFLNAWARAEGGGASNNPFNTTQSGFGETGNYNSVGVKNYGDPMAGINATVHTLQNGRYGNILAALHKGNDPMAAANALAASPWGTGGLVRTILGAGTPVTAPALPGGTRPVPQPTPGLTATPPATGMAPGSGLRALLSSSIADTNKLLGLPNLQLPTAMPKLKVTPLPGRAGVNPPVAPMQGVSGIAKTALSQIGIPYQWGGQAKLGSRTDCSGLLQASAAANGVRLGRTTYEQWKQGTPVALNQLQAGDAVFFHMGSRGPEHVAIYIGNGRVVEDPHTGASVSVSTLAGRGAIGARRY